MLTPNCRIEFSQSAFFHLMQSIEQWRDDISCTTKMKFISKIVFHRTMRDENAKKNGNYRKQMSKLCSHWTENICWLYLVVSLRLNWVLWTAFKGKFIFKYSLLSSVARHSSKCIYLEIGIFIKISMLFRCRCHRLFLSIDIFSLSSFRFSSKKKQKFRSFYILARFYRRTLPIDSNKCDSAYTDAEYDEDSDEK